MLPIAPLLYPLVNGHRHDYSSVEIDIGGFKYHGVKSITYRHNLDPGVLRGNRAGLIGRTRGTYTAEGSVEFYRAEYEQFLSSLTGGGLGAFVNAPGYMEAIFDITVSYSEAFSPLLTDKLIACRLKSAENSHAEGNDPLTVKCDLSIMYLVENGKYPVSQSQLVK